MSYHSVTNQPQAILDLESLDFKQSIPVHEKGPASLENDSDDHHCEHGQTSFSEHKRCHNSRLRRFLLPTISVLVLALLGFLAWNCVHGMPVPGWGVNLMGRATDNSNQSAFVHKKRKLGTIVLLIPNLIVSLRFLYSLYYCCRIGWTSSGWYSWYHVVCMVL